MYTPIQFTDIPWLVAGLFLMLFLALFAMRPGGLLALQIQCLRDTHTVRFFDQGDSFAGVGSAVMCLSYMLIFGLTLFCGIHQDDAAELLSVPSLQTLLTIGVGTAIPLVWFLFQWFLFNWFSYLLGIEGDVIIMNRVYTAIHVLAMPLALLLLLALVLVPIPSKIVLILLSVLFILTQIVFIFNGFKIFLRDSVSALLIFLYLCTLEIAPLFILIYKLKGVS